MALTPKVIANINHDLNKGVDVKDIASKYKVGRATVYNMRAELKEKGFETNIIDTARVTPQALDVVIKAVEANSATVPADFAEDVQKTVDALKSLQLLEVKMHSTLQLALTKAEDILNQENLSIIDWQIVMNTIANCHKDVFSKGSVTNNLINGDMVGNKKGDSLTMFQSRMGN